MKQGVCMRVEGEVGCTRVEGEARGVHEDGGRGRVCACEWRAR